MKLACDVHNKILINWQVYKYAWEEFNHWKSKTTFFNIRGILSSLHAGWQALSFIPLFLLLFWPQAPELKPILPFYLTERNFIFHSVCDIDNPGWRIVIRKNKIGYTNRYWYRYVYIGKCTSNQKIILIDQQIKTHSPTHWTTDLKRWAPVIFLYNSKTQIRWNFFTYKPKYTARIPEDWNLYQQRCIPH